MKIKIYWLSNGYGLNKFPSMVDGPIYIKSRVLSQYYASLSVYCDLVILIIENEYRGNYRSSLQIFIATDVHWETQSPRLFFEQILMTRRQWFNVTVHCEGWVMNIDF